MTTPAQRLPILLRYRVGLRLALLEQLRNRLAFGLLLIFIPVWYYLLSQIASDQPVLFKSHVTNSFLSVDARHIVLLTAGLNGITLIISFMLYSATRRDTDFDHRLVLSGFPQPLAMLVKLTVLLLVAAVVSLYAALVLLAFYRPDSLPEVWLGFVAVALSYGSLGILMGVLVRNELTGFFVLIMLSLIDTSIQNPIGNPIANKPFVEGFPAFGPMQAVVAGAFTHSLALRYVGLGLAWALGFLLAGLAIFYLRTRAKSLRPIVARPAPGPPPATDAPTAVPARPPAPSAPPTSPPAAAGVDGIEVPGPAPAATGSRLIAAIAPVPHVGKATVTLMLAHQVASLHGGLVIALGVLPEEGSPWRRVQPATSGSIAPLLRPGGERLALSQVLQFTTRTSSGLHLLAPEARSEAGIPLGEAEYAQIVRTLSCHFDVVLCDVAVSALAPAARDILPRADQVLLCCSPAEEAVRRATLTLEWLQGQHPGQRGRDPVVVLNHTAERSETADPDRARAWFAGRSKEVVTIPWDPQLATVPGITPRDLSVATKRAYRQLVTTVAQAISG